MLDFTMAGSLIGRVRADYVGNLSHVATGSGAHYFYVGGDSAVGTAYLTVSSTGISTPGSIVFNAGTLSTATSYGSFSASGSTGGYAGVQFPSTTNNRTFMVSNTGGIAGMYDQGSSAWEWYFTSGTLTVGTVPGANVSGTVSAATTANGLNMSAQSGSTANDLCVAVSATGSGSVQYSGGATLTAAGALTASSYNGCTIPSAGSVPGANGIPRTDANGYLYTYYINDSSPTETFTPTYIYGNNGSDNFIRRTAQSNVTAGACSGNSATVTCYGGRTDPTAYPILWANPGSTTASQPTYACSAVTITSSTGTVTATGFTTSSDRTKKDNIRVIHNAQEIVQSLNGVKFDWKSNGVPSVGVIAQDVEAVLPELVQTDDEGTKSVNYNGLIGVLIEAVKALTERVTQLEAK
jgi:hypothetical protein